jgi:hypothetical protein
MQGNLQPSWESDSAGGLSPGRPADYLTRNSGGCCLLPLLLKTFAAENRPSLRWLEGNGGVLSTLGTCGAGFGFGGRLSWNRRPQHGNAFCFTGLATFRLVFELLVVKEKLFARGKNKVGTAVDTLENLVLKFHPSPHSPVARSA